MREYPRNNSDLLEQTKSQTVFNEESPMKLEDHFIIDKSKKSHGLATAVTGSGNLVFGKSIKNMKS